MNILHIDSSILGDNSASRLLTADVVATLTSAHPDANVVYRDVAKEPTPHLSINEFSSRSTPASERTAEQVQASAPGDAVLAEFLAADTIVIGAPMYNFTVSTQLKAWIDRVVVAGSTFSYGANGPKGLVSGKRVIIVLSSGAKYAGTTSSGAHEGYLAHVFGFLGVTNLELIHAEGLAYGPDAREASLSGAKAEIAGLA